MPKQAIKPLPFFCMERFKDALIWLIICVILAFLFISYKVIMTNECSTYDCYVASHTSTLPESPPLPPPPQISPSSNIIGNSDSSSIS